MSLSQIDPREPAQHSQGLPPVYLDQTDHSIQALIQRGWYRSAWSNITTALQWWIYHAPSQPGSLERICIHLKDFPDPYLKSQARESEALFLRLKPFMVDLSDSCKQHLIRKQATFIIALGEYIPPSPQPFADPLQLKRSLCLHAQEVVLAKIKHLEISYTLLQDNLNRAAQFALCDFWKNYFVTELKKLKNTPVDDIEAALTPFPSFQHVCETIQETLNQLALRSFQDPIHFLNVKMSQQLITLETPPQLSVQDYHTALETFRETFRTLGPDTRQEQRRIFEAFQTFFNVLFE